MTPENPTKTPTTTSPLARLDAQFTPTAAPISDTVQRYLQDALKGVPPDKHGAILVYTTAGETKGVLAFRAGDHWEFAAHADYKGGHDLTYGAAVQFTW